MINYVLVFALISRWIYDPVSYINDTLHFTPLVVRKEYGIVRLKVGLSFVKTCVIVHRGTENIRDLLVDLMSGVRHGCDDYGIVNSFSDNFESYEDMLVYDMDQTYAQSECDEFFTVGHSLGGSRAIAFAARFEEKVDLVVTFGAPKTCCENYDENKLDLVRVVNYNGAKNDPIPSLPIFKDYYSCGGKFVKLGNGGTLRVSKSHMDDDEEYDDHVDLDFLESHHINSYIESLLE